MSVAIIIAIIFSFIAFAAISQMSLFSPKVKAVGNAVAIREGFGPSGNLPTRTNNPGDLKLGDIGYGTDNGITVMPSLDEGWRRLYHEWNVIATGNSSEIFLAMNWYEAAYKYTGGDNDKSWAEFVAGKIGVDPNSTLGEYFGETQSA